MTKYSYSILLILYMCICNLSAQTTERQDKSQNYILLLNSISFEYEWARGFLDELQKEYGSQIEIRSKELFIPLISTMEQVQALQSSLLEEYSTPPKLVIYIGDPGWIATKDLFDNQWKDIPILITYSQSMMPHNVEALINKEKGLDALVPKAEIIKEYNIATFEQPFFIRETVEMMRRLLPDMDRIAFIYDERYISFVLKEEFDRDIAQYYPQIKVDHLSPQYVDTEKLLDTISSYGSNVGIIYYSWFTLKKDSVSIYLGDNIQKALYAFAQNPIFVLSDQNPAAGNFAGGYYISIENSNKVVYPILNRMLSGEVVNHTYKIGVDQATKYLDHIHLQRHNISTKLYPDDAYYYNAPPTFFEEYKIHIIGSLIILLLMIILGVLWLRININRQSQTQKYRIFLQSILDNLPISVKVTDLNNNMAYVYVNKQAETMLGINREELIGKRDSLSDLYTESLTDTEKLQTNIDTISNISKYKFADQVEHSLLITRHSIDGLDDNHWLISSALDVTEMESNRVELEALYEEYKLVLKGARMTIMNWDIPNEVLHCNTEFDDDMLSITHKKTVLTTQEYFSMIHPEDLSGLKAQFEALNHNHISIFAHEYRYMDSENENGFVWVKGYAIIGKRDDEGKPLHIVGATMNINERKKMEQELQRAKEDAEESNRMKSAFLANMSHEIRTPLNAIVGFSSILSEVEDPQERQEYQKIIEFNTSALLQIINDILDLSKVESGTFDFVYSDVNLRDMLCRVEHSARTRKITNGVTLSVDADTPQIAANLECNRVMQVMSNFVSNAIKFTKEGSIKIGCKITDEHKNLYFYVTDTGCGISPDNIERVFDRFVKVDSFEQGTGLGLPICKMIAEKLNGKIGVESQIGKGSTFWMEIPYIAPKA